MVSILEKITKGQGELADLDLLEKIGSTMQQASLCGLGRTAPNPVLTALRYFHHEFEEHIVEKSAGLWFVQILFPMSLMKVNAPVVCFA